MKYRFLCVPRGKVCAMLDALGQKPWQTQLMGLCAPGMHAYLPYSGSVRLVLQNNFFRSNLKGRCGTSTGVYVGEGLVCFWFKQPLEYNVKIYCFDETYFGLVKASFRSRLFSVKWLKSSKYGILLFLLLTQSFMSTPCSFLPVISVSLLSHLLPFSVECW